MGSIIALLFCILYVLLPQISAHAFVTDPLPRGALAGQDMITYRDPFDKNAPKDYELHFPAGNRVGEPGTGARSQKEAAKKWTTYQPMLPGFQWRAGVCGDLQGGVEAHRQGGRFYYNATIVRTMKRGGVVNFQASIVGHHNGFFVFHLCNLDKCKGDISKACFLVRGACRQLLRAPNPVCDSGKDKSCAPIDRNYPARWYIPCAINANQGGWDAYGVDNRMLYKLPKYMVCEHCVLQWQYTVGNTCNAPGVAAYFTGDDRPTSWAGCDGQSGAKGGYTEWMSTCGGDRFTEEYYNCADVRIIA